MGEMADFVNDSQDHWNNDVLNDAFSHPAPTLKTCRCCGAKGLHWEKNYGKWRLFESDGRMHRCPASPQEPLRCVPVEAQTGDPEWCRSDQPESACYESFREGKMKQEDKYMAVPMLAIAVAFGSAGLVGALFDSGRAFLGTLGGIMAFAALVGIIILAADIDEKD